MHDSGENMPVAVSERSEALRDADRSGVAIGDAELTRAPAIVGEYDAHEGSEDGGCELSVAQQPESQAVRQ